MSLCANVFKAVGCPKGSGMSTHETLKCLRSRSLSRLFKHATDYGAIGGFPWLPIGDASYSFPFFSNDSSNGIPKQLILKGPVLNVPIMMGTTRDDGLLVTSGHYHKSLKYIQFASSLKESNTAGTLCSSLEGQARRTRFPR